MSHFLVFFPSLHNTESQKPTERVTIVMAKTHLSFCFVRSDYFLFSLKFFFKKNRLQTYVNKWHRKFKHFLCILETMSVTIGISWNGIFYELRNWAPSCFLSHSSVNASNTWFVPTRESAQGLEPWLTTWRSNVDGGVQSNWSTNAITWKHLFKMNWVRTRLQQAFPFRHIS